MRTGTGAVIRRLRTEQGMTQKQLAEQLNVSDKAVSKWERGMGCPDISLLRNLSVLLQVDIGSLLSGVLTPNDDHGGNMKKTQYYVCPSCGNISLCTGAAEVHCCGRRLEALVPVKAGTEERLKVEQIEDEWFVTSEHPMDKSHYLTFAAFVTGDRIQLIKLYPEWDMQVRIPRKGHGMLMWCCSVHGLFYQLI